MNTPDRKPLRLWPGVVIAVLLCLLRFAVPVVFPEATAYGVLAGPVGWLAIVVWWVFLSRAPWAERLGAILLMIVALFATFRIVDESISTGAMGVLLVMLATPILSLALVAWAVTTRSLRDRYRRAAMVVTILLSCGVWTLFRTGGLTANFNNDLHWRWTKTPEEQLLTQSSRGPAALPPALERDNTSDNRVKAQPDKEPTALQPTQPTLKTREKPLSAPLGSNPPLPPASSKVGTAPEWPGFRGPHRDSIIPGVRIKTDWTASPPLALWRRPIGPAWSSFAVHGGLLYTQEQRGAEEIVACYKLADGDPVWAHRDTARFWESNGGAGPRATPALSKGRVYTFGATGVLNALDAKDGSVVWSHNAAADTGTKVPQWGFAGSPLVVDDVVIVATAGQLVAYDAVAGTRRWSGPPHGVSYSSPHLATIDGIEQVLQLSEAGVTSVAFTDGTLLWEHQWKGFPIVQPALTANGDVLVSVSDKSGTRCLTASHGPVGWTVRERWTSNGLKPYFNDFVIHNGHAFGFDGSILACIDLRDGKRKWKGGRYGNGQLILLSDQDLLLVLSEEGELALVGATTDRFTELARFPAIEGKTWNHPVLAGDLLLVRNGQEMAAFRLPLAGP